EGDDDDDQDEGNDDDQDIDEEGEEFIHPKLSIHDEEETKEEESFDPIIKTPENSDDEGNDDENLGLNVGSEEGQDAEYDEDELYRDVNINLEGRVVQMEYVHTTQEFEDTHVTLTPVNPDGIDSLFETTSQMDVQAPTTVASLTLSAPTLNLSTITTISTVPQAPTPPTTALSNLLQDLPNFGSFFGFDHRLKTLEANFSDQDEVPYAGSDRGSKRRREGKEPESTRAPKEKVTKTTGKSTQRSKSQQNTASESAPAEEPIQTTQDLEEHSHQEFETCVIVDQHIAEASQHTECESAPAEEPMQTTHDLEEPSYQELEIGAADDQPIVEASQNP
nr:hypothetical protein [Tanacetum cinerariifolium]